MSLIKKRFNTETPLPSILPEVWKATMGNCDVLLFDSLDQFVFTVAKLTQNKDSMCDISYADALRKLVRKESDFPKEEQESIRNLVRANLFKRGLITEEVYEDFKYAAEGTQIGIDVGKYLAGEPDCILTPSKQYVDFFYELYVNVSYSYDVENKNIRKNVAKLLATVEELERQHIFIKINVILPVQEVKELGKGDFYSSIPVFSHKDFKSVDVMSSVINDRLLRKFYFAVLEDLYGENLAEDYGFPMQLGKAINIGDELNETELFETIVHSVNR